MPKTTPLLLLVYNSLQGATMATIYFMAWDEHERGWGRRTDGASIHASPDHCLAYIKQYWSRQPASTPDEYESPSWDKPKALECDAALAALVMAQGDIRLSKSCYRATDECLVALSPQLLAAASLALSTREAAEIDQAAKLGSKAPAKRSL
jgi:hypothetical protein